MIGRRRRRRRHRGRGEASIEVESGEVFLEVENLSSLLFLLLPEFRLEVVFEQSEALGGGEVGVHVHEIPELQNACLVLQGKAPKGKRPL